MSKKNRLSSLLKASLEGFGDPVIVADDVTPVSDDVQVIAPATDATDAVVDDGAAAPVVTEEPIPPEVTGDAGSEDGAGDPPAVVVVDGDTPVDGSGDMAAVDDGAAPMGGDVSEEGKIGAIAGGALGAMAGSTVGAPILGAVAGAAIGHGVQKAFSSNHGHESMESAMIDLREGEIELASLEADQARLEEIAAGLESICADLSLAHEEGGLTPQAARWMRQSMEAYVTPLGFELADINVPSCESFGGGMTRIKATEVSLESAGDVLKKVIDALKTVGMKILQAVVSFIQRVITTSGRLSSRAQKLIDEAKGLSGAPKSSQIDLGNLTAKIAVDGKVPGNIVQAASELTKVFLIADERLSEVTLGARKSHAAYARIHSLKDENIDDFVKELAASYNMQPPANAYKADSTDNDGNKMYRTQPLPGGRTFVVIVGEGVYKEGVIDADSPSEDAKINVLTPADLQKIGEICLTIGNKVSEYKQVGAEYQKTMEETNKDLEQFASVNLSEESVEKLKKALRAATNHETTNMKAYARMLGYVVMAAMAFVQVGEKCLAQYGEAAEPKQVEDKSAKPAAA